MTFDEDSDDFVQIMNKIKRKKTSKSLEKQVQSKIQVIDQLFLDFKNDLETISNISKNEAKIESLKDERIKLNASVEKLYSAFESDACMFKEKLAKLEKKQDDLFSTATL